MQLGQRHLFGLVLLIGSTYPTRCGFQLRARFSNEACVLFVLYQKESHCMHKYNTFIVGACFILPPMFSKPEHTQYYTLALLIELDCAAAGCGRLITMFAIYVFTHACHGLKHVLNRFEILVHHEHLSHTRLPKGVFKVHAHWTLFLVGS